MRADNISRFTTSLARIACLLALSAGAVPTAFAGEFEGSGIPVRGTRLHVGACSGPALEVALPSWAADGFLFEAMASSEAGVEAGQTGADSLPALADSVCVDIWIDIEVPENPGGPSAEDVAVWSRGQSPSLSSSDLP